MSVSRAVSTHGALLGELQAVHAMLRRDLQTCRQLARDTAGGASTTLLRQGLAQLNSRSLLFELRANCLSYCQLVYRHHRGEDLALFPAVRREAPHLAAALDRLELDHRAVSDLLDEIESAANTLHDDHLDHPDHPDHSTEPVVECSTKVLPRRRLAMALDALSNHLLAHLDREEQTLAPVLATWSQWPSQA